ncbi:maleylpyruvate isomerase family mycothiol-dependent enzyme [Microbispora sp. H13382]|uniref:maleylpyruvate isomerase family mycothiol-dependent enzyme n=1 Tax=Microbispora sp. H13382 TaxID=2729112 RepID=UPI0016018E9C|nr:maleylpyruvate isomerase family mycothiol-dependent enzyme [Microbispora sp. H13382]
MDTDVRRQIAAERRELADLLGELPPQSWDAPSLCAGWRVREVVAHMTSPYRRSGLSVLAGLVRARGNFDRLADRLARGDAAAFGPRELTACLRDNAEHPWRPPGGGYAGALSHDVIHGMDITVALGIDRRIPADRLRVLLDHGMSPRSLRYFGVELDGVELRADDVDWSLGTGTPLSGAAQDLVLVLCGRRLPEGRLRGEPAARFTRSVR